MRKLSSVLLDLGGVVFPLDLKRVENELGPGSENFSSFEAFHSFESGQLSIGAFQLKMEQILKRSFTRNEFISIFHAMILEPLRESLRAIEMLAQKMPVDALSNINPIHAPLVDAHPVRRSLRFFFRSDVLGVRKPHHEIYVKILKTLGGDPTSILFIDDREENLQSAKALGFVTELCQPGPEALLEILQKYELVRSSELS